MRSLLIVVAAACAFCRSVAGEVACPPANITHVEGDVTSSFCGSVVFSSEFSGVLTVVPCSSGCEHRIPSPPTMPLTAQPTQVPTGTPTETPTEQPTGYPTGYPTTNPTAQPTTFPTELLTSTSPPPTLFPTEIPTEAPTTTPTLLLIPTSVPSQSPTLSPTNASVAPGPAPPIIADTLSGSSDNKKVAYLSASVAVGVVFVVLSVVFILCLVKRRSNREAVVMARNDLSDDGNISFTNPEFVKNGVLVWDEPSFSSEKHRRAPPGATFVTDENYETIQEHPISKASYESEIGIYDQRTTFGDRADYEVPIPVKDNETTQDDSGQRVPTPDSADETVYDNVEQPIDAHLYNLASPDDDTQATIYSLASPAISDRLSPANDTAAETNPVYDTATETTT